MPTWSSLFNCLLSVIFTLHGSCPAGVCSVWSEYNYMTFDGKSYRFNESCSYYLVKEIVTKYNLTIILNNHDCNPSDSTFCPQSLTVTYGSYEVLLTQLKTSGTTVNAVSNMTVSSSIKVGQMYDTFGVTNADWSFLMCFVSLCFRCM